MKKNLRIFLLIISLIIISNLSHNSIQAQTAGTLTGSFTTVSTGGYTPKNCIAVWIETSSGTFIKTKLKNCSNSNLDHLTTWTGKSGQNVVDAVTGSTRTTNGQINFTWNGTNVSSSVVTDGVYKIWIEFAWASSLTTGKIVESYSFTKGTAADHQTPTGSANISAITLDWAPNTTGITENKNQKMFTVFPNPITKQSIVNYTLNELTDVTVSLYDVNGKLVDVLLDENQNVGKFSLPLNIDGKLKAGVYFLKMYSGKTQYTEKVMITE